MPISGLVINIDPVKYDTIVAELQIIPGLELSPSPTGGPLVAVIDVSTTYEEERIFKQINDLPGVQRVSLSYHNFEDLVDQAN